jgi:Mn2+/Fe2+ NRAMP family transporter
MGEHRNTLLFNVVSWITAVSMIILTFILVLQALTQALRPASS